MLKILSTIAAIFTVVLSVAMVTAAWPMMPQMALFAIGLTFLFAIGAGLVGLYYFLGRAKIQHATAYSITLEAGKVAATNSVLVLNKQLIQLPNWTPSAAPNLIAAPALAEIAEAAGLPTAPSLAGLLDSGFVPTQQRMLLGYSNAGPLYGPIADLLSVAVAGRPGQGKSSLLRFIYGQVVLAGGDVFSLDPHGSIADDVAGAPALWSASSGSELDDGAAWVIEELDKRLADYRVGQREFKPIMGLVDEFPVISLSSKAAVAAVGRVILEGRKVKMFSLISGQGLPASQFGGSLFRDALSSRYVFKTSAKQGQMAGLEKEQRELLDRLDVGRAIFDGPVDKPLIVAIPWTEGSDLLRLASPRHQPQRGPSEAQKGQSTAAPVEPPTEAYTRSKTGGAGDVITAQFRELPAAPSEVERAARAWKAGNNSVRKLALALGVSDWQARRLAEQLRADGRL